MVGRRKRRQARDAGRMIFGHFCPECGAKMVEAERVNENGFVFVWFKCSRTGCRGQWLEKRLFDGGSVGVSVIRAAHIVGVR
jgi:hypothetical protein